MDRVANLFSVSFRIPSAYSSNGILGSRYEVKNDEYTFLDSLDESALTGRHDLRGIALQALGSPAGRCDEFYKDYAKSDLIQKRSNRQTLPSGGSRRFGARRGAVTSCCSRRSAPAGCRALATSSAARPWSPCTGAGPSTAATWTRLPRAAGPTAAASRRCCPRLAWYVWKESKWCVGVRREALVL